jgi:hypothetical protein
MLTPHILLAFAELAAIHGNNHERLRHLQQARLLFEHQGATGHARRVATEIPAAAT